MKIQAVVKTALDELRMQMLGTQVLFGFQLQSAFQDNFQRLTRAARWADGAALILITCAIGLLIAVPCQHRLIEQGRDTVRIYRTANRFAEGALAPLAAAMGLDIFVVSEGHLGHAAAVTLGGIVAATALFILYGFGRALRRLYRNTSMQNPDETPTPLHAKIEQMLTEARVVLPGAQALLGFQFVVTLTAAFSELPGTAKMIHFAGLLAVTLSIALLLAPAAIHRITFRGRDAAAFHTIGSRLVTLALAPLVVGVSADVYVAVAKILGDAAVAVFCAASVFVLLTTLWYVMPLMLRASAHGASRAAGE